MAFEDEFGCEIPDDAGEKIVTVKDAVRFIQDNNCASSGTIPLNALGAVVVDRHGAGDGGL